ncbi:hypothetical protein JYU34_013158 [Plutella xylostella]|uniref:Uncharacterized protein n=1 Tax=Plutella xylostella TaxID=51655 RepID=A0ABQ7QGQ9_PLUXY|nr:hypothetical protein JYU34_013158 [Plutella xylostella]
MGRHGLNEISTSGDTGEPEKKFKPIAETYRKFTLAMVMGMMYPNPRTERRRLIYLRKILGLASSSDKVWFIVSNFIG